MCPLAIAVVAKPRASVAVTPARARRFITRTLRFVARIIYYAA
jgi:hypothetical protein